MSTLSAYKVHKVHRLPGPHPPPHRALCRQACTVAFCYRYRADKASTAEQCTRCSLSIPPSFRETLPPFVFQYNPGRFAFHENFTCTTMRRTISPSARTPLRETSGIGPKNCSPDARVFIPDERGSLTRAAADSDSFLIRNGDVTWNPYRCTAEQDSEKSLSSFNEFSWLEQFLFEFYIILGEPRKFLLDSTMWYAVFAL